MTIKTKTLINSLLVTLLAVLLLALAVDFLTKPKKQFFKAEPVALIKPTVVKKRPYGFKLYRRKHEEVSSGLVLIIDGLGLQQKLLNYVTQNFPKSATLSFVPYANDLQQQMQKCKQLGYELLLNVLVQPLTTVDYGPLALTPQDSAENVLQKIQKILAYGSAYIGGLITGANLFVHEEGLVDQLAAHFERENLLLIDASLSHASVVGSLLKKRLEPHVRANFVIDRPLLFSGALPEVLTKISKRVLNKKTTVIVVDGTNIELLKTVDAWLKAQSTIKLIALSSQVDKLQKW